MLVGGQVIINFFLFLFITYKTMIATLIYIKMLQGHRLGC